MTLRPQLSYLAHRFNPRIFQNRNVPTIPSRKFGNEQELKEYDEKHGVEFGSKTKDDYLVAIHYIINNGTEVKHLYQSELRAGYIQLMGTNRKGEAKFAFVGTNKNNEITTLHTKSGKDFWKTINNSSQDKIVRPSK